MKITELIDFKTFTYNWDKIESIPEFAILKECEQNPTWHSEGNAWIHTKLVCNAASDICRSNHWENEEGYASLLLTSALFHDIGKGLTTRQGKDGRWHAYNHEFVGEKITRRLLWDEGFPFREQVCALVRYHMAALQVFESKNMLERIADISRNIPYWKILILLKRCDILGSLQKDEIGKHADLIKMDSLEMITKQMSCNVSSFKDYANDYKKFVNSKTKKHVDAAVMIGLPGAGKSTVTKYLTENKGLFENAVVISRDELRYELGFCAQGKKTILGNAKEQLVTKESDKRILAAAKEGKPIILDNLNLKKEYRDAYKALLSNYDVSWHYYYVEAPKLDDNIKRREGQVEKYMFFDMIGKFEMPLRDEYDSFVCIKTDEKHEIPYE